MDQLTIRLISQSDIEGLHSCLDRVARERKYLGFTEALSSKKQENRLLNTWNGIYERDLPIRFEG